MYQGKNKKKWEIIAFLILENEQRIIRFMVPLFFIAVGGTRMNYTQYVNVKQGTKSLPRFSQGNTLPLVQTPFAMNAFALQTDSSRGSWFYHPEDHSLEGIRLTHQPSPWISDYGCITMMPTRNELYSAEGHRWSGYRPEETILEPSYLKADFLRYRATVELAPTERGAFMNVSYAGDKNTGFSLFAVKNDCSYTVDVKNRMVTGSTNAHSWEVSDNFAMYFAISFDCDIDEENTYVLHPEKKPVRGLTGEGERVGISVGLTKKEVQVKIATSYISVEQAKETLRKELDGKTFHQVREEADHVWNSYLSRVEIEAKNEAQKKTFYTCLWRTLLFPRKFYEIDADGNAYHYCADTGIVASGIKYVDNGFWDTYRTVYPLLSIIAPEMFAEILEGFVGTYKDCGWLPKWPAPSEVGMMPGTLIDAVIAEAAVKGIGSKEVLEKAYEGVMKHATQESPIQKYGRHGTDDYNKYGYIPREKYHECVNHTLDYVYGDFCIAQTADALGHHEEAKKFKESAKNYRLIFDPETGFMRGKDVNGNMAENFDEFGWGGEYCEGGPWQSSFAVYHDFEGLAELHGGKEKLIKKLDELFETKPYYNCGGYQVEIHEMTEMAAVDFGQCAISNQPSFHYPYIYAKLGAADKAEYWVKKLAQEAFSYKDDGFPGDEDNGTMAAWYVFSALGLYPLCPGKPEYVRIRPLVDRAVIHTANGTFEIKDEEVTNNIIMHDTIVGKH